MVTRKRAEPAWRAIARKHNWYLHKYGDVRYAVCPKCRTQFPLPKTENAPDFSVGLVYTYVECKNGDSTGAWSWIELLPEGGRANQRKWLLEWDGWLFIELGDGPAPKGKSAYLVPFDLWVGQIEPQLLELGMRSIRRETLRNRPGSDILLAEYALTWSEGSWCIPDNHIWWRRQRAKLQAMLDTVGGHLTA